MDPPLSPTLHHRQLDDVLRSWGPDAVARLLVRRPDLSQPDPCRTIDELAERAANTESVRDALDDVTLAEDRLLQVIVCCPPAVPLLDLARALPDGVSLDDVEPVLASLEEAALVWRHDGRLYTVEALPDIMPVALGPPLSLLVPGQPVSALKQTIANIGDSLDAVGFDGPVPAMPSRLDRKAPARADLIGHLETLLRGPGIVPALLDVAPPAAADLAIAFLERGGALEGDFYLLHHDSSFGGRYPSRTTPQQWLFERGLLFPIQGRGVAFQPREVGVSLRDGRPVSDLALAVPELVTGTVAQDEVDGHGAMVALTAVGHLSDLLERLATTPEKELKSGGLGVSSLKRFGAELDVDTDHVARLFELLHLGGLLESVTETTKAGRTYTYTAFVTPSAAARAWLAQPPTEQWRQIATAWWRAWFWPSASGRKDVNGKNVPVLAVQHAVDAVARRRDVIATLAALDDGQRTSHESLTSFVRWRRPRPWLDCEAGPPDECVRGIVAEAELLGIVAHGRLTSFGAALTIGRPEGTPAGLLDAALPRESTAFTLLPDLTAIVVGRLRRDTMTTLRLMADIESVGSATTLRFSDASPRPRHRALSRRHPGLPRRPRRQGGAQAPRLPRHRPGPASRPPRRRRSHRSDHQRRSRRAGRRLLAQAHPQARPATRRADRCDMQPSHRQGARQPARRGVPAHHRGRDRQGLAQRSEGREDGS
jgi:hypothetical protein